MELLSLIAIFFVTSIISVVTGSTSLIIVPVMLQFGIEPRSAVATNMLALTLMSMGASFSFHGRDLINQRRMPLIIVLTLAGSILGALLLVIIPSRAIPVIISTLMIAVSLFSVVRRDMGLSLVECDKSSVSEITGYAVTFVLGIYGGFFSGGYVTILTVAFIALFGMTFLQAVVTTKMVNIFSSLVATLIFMWQGLVDYRLGILMGIVMFTGGLIGGRVALKLSNIWLRRIFLTQLHGLTPISRQFLAYLGLFWHRSIIRH
jgi:uncharacterized membrane protein YfcA